MKSLKKLNAIAIFAFIAILGTSCNDDDNETMQTPMPESTITETAVKTADLSILVQALTRVGLDKTLQNPGEYTVFAPTNDAFVKFLADNKIASLSDVSDEDLTEILLNHVVVGKYKSTDLSTGYIKTLAKSKTSGSNTMSMYVDLTSGVKLNGISSVITADISASNGVVHIVDAVIGLPTIVTHAVANPNFSTLVSVVTNENQSAILTALSGTDPLTVFAPTNGGFTKLNNDLIDLGIDGGIGGVSQATITNVLLYHVLSGNNLAANLSSTDYTTLLGQKFKVELMGGAKIIDNNNRTSNIIITDVQCSNGVIHAIDNALLPSL